MTTKNPSTVSNSLNSSKLSRVALLAGAAAAFPLAGHADTIFYSGPQSITETATGTNGDQTYTVNLDGNNVSGFTFTATDSIGKAVYVTPVAPTSFYVADSTDPNANPTALTEGTPITLSSTFAQGQGTIQYKFGPDTAGNWPADGTPAFLGVEFQDTDPAAGTSPNNTYCGWVELGAQTSSNATYTIDGWAYDQSGCSIQAGQTGPGTFVTPPVPEPASLALFGLGAAGIFALRARRKAARP